MEPRGLPLEKMGLMPPHGASSKANMERREKGFYLQ